MRYTSSLADPPVDGGGFMSIGLYWVQIQGDDCAAACGAASRTALDGGKNKASFTACAFSEDGEWWWPGALGQGRRVHTFHCQLLIF